MYKKIFIFTVLGIALFCASPVFANDNLIVEFEKTPLFNEANFLPGQSITRWAEVTNNSGQTERIAVEAINVSDPYNLGTVLNLEIKEGGITLYNKPLSAFFNAGEEFLSNLADNDSTTYDFSVSFYSGAQNPFQGKSLGFDILIGFQAEEGGILPGAGGGGDGYLPPGLTITNESTEEVGEISVTITWLTSYSSTSRVIYAKEGGSHTLDLTYKIETPPKYGYAWTTPEYDVSPKVTSHLVTIFGLDSNTKYYFRCVSHGSFAVSTEHSFTTLSVIGEQEEEEPAFAEALAGKEEVVVEGETEETEETEQIVDIAKQIGEEPPVSQSGEQEKQTSFLAAVGNIISLGTNSITIGIIVLLVILGIAGYGIYELIWKKRIKERK